MTLRGAVRGAGVAYALILAPLLCAQPSPADLASARATLQRLITTQDYQEYGFDSYTEVGEATLDVPFRRFFVTATKLIAYRDSDKAEALLRDGGEWLYPVTARGKVRCFATIANRGAGWQLQTIGRADIAETLAAVRAQQVPSVNLQPTAFFLVDVMALGIYLPGWRTDGKMPNDPSSSATLLVFNVQYPGKKILGPAGAQAAAGLFRVFRNEARKVPRGAPGGR